MTIGSDSRTQVLLLTCHVQRSEGVACAFVPVGPVTVLGCVAVRVCFGQTPQLQDEDLMKYFDNLPQCFLASKALTVLASLLAC